MYEQLALPLLDEPATEPTPPATHALEYDPVLFGKDPTPYIVAVEPIDSRIRLFIREGGQTRTVEEPFRPWLLSDMRMEMDGVHWQELKGELEGRRMLKHLAVCDGREAFEDLRRALRDAHREIIAYGSLARQYLMQSGKTLFKGMTFADLHRVQLDIETSTLTPDQAGAQILMIALSDTRGYEAVLDGDEKQILEQLVERIQALDPDVIEGHNLFGFDLPYLAARAQALGVPLRLGRDGSELRFGSPRQCIIGANSRTFTPAFAHGRHLIDTYLSVQRFDIGRGELEGYGLKEVAQQLGIAAPDRIYLEREQIPDLWHTDPETVRRYCLQDVHETRRLADLTLPTEFYQCQMLPDTLQNLATIGTGEKANLMFLRAYLAEGYAVPAPQGAREYPGGYTEVRQVGLIPRIVKADVESLYPSVMLRYGIKPRADHLNVFLPTLERLRRLRLDAKARAKQTQGAESAYWDGLQNSFKILINCFDAMTEVFTPDGFKPISQVAVGDWVYSINPTTQQVSLKPVVVVYKQSYAGKMVRLRSGSVDFLLTPNHRCLVRHRSGKLEWRYAHELVGKGEVRLPRLCPLPAVAPAPEVFDLAQWCEANDVPYEEVRKGDVVKIRYPCAGKVGQPHKAHPRYYALDDFLRLVGWYISEGVLHSSQRRVYPNGHVRGVYYRVSLTQKRAQGREVIAQLLQRLGIEYSEDGNGLHFCSRLWYEFFLRECGSGSREKRIPSWVFRWEAERLHPLFEAMMAGDGDTRATGKRFSTVSPQLREDFLRLCVHLGVRTTDRGYDGCYRIGVCTKGTKPRLHRQHISWADYEGEIYCLTVADNHTVLAGRNKTLNWTGQSYYGYLGAPFHFNDYDAAEQVTLTGQELVKQIAAEIERQGGLVVEIDTDGVYFQPPPEVQTEADEIAFVERVGAVLPEGIRLAYDGRYKAMLSLKTKNYVLQGYDGKLTFKGASLRSRADEKFGREFLNSATQWLLNGEPERVVAEYRRLARAILNGEVDIEQLCRRERVTQKSKQDTHPLYPLAKRFQIGDYIMVYRKRDGSLGLLEEYADDEDREHYVDKLYKFAARLEPLFPDFDAQFAKPQAIIQAEKQPGLFD
jgi:DNA polymerase I